MSRQEAIAQYTAALKRGQKEMHDLGNPRMPALDDLLTNQENLSQVNVGLTEIPADRIVGSKSEGRISAFSPSFFPLLSVDSEFAAKWINLCMAHLGPEGIRDPIVCYEYLGNFYVQEGNKRVSVLRSYDSPKIPAIVYRILPAKSEAPEILAYYEFLDFYQSTKIYDIQFRKPGGYAKLLKSMGKTLKDPWTTQEKRSLIAAFHYFKEAFHQQSGKQTNIAPEEALLVWLQVHTVEELCTMSSSELKKALGELWNDVAALSEPDPVDVRTEAVDAPKSGLLTKLISSTPEHLNVAFVHMLNPESSEWVRSHEEGKRKMEEALGEKVTVRSYFDADTPELQEAVLSQAVADGAQVIFTTSVQLSNASLKLAVKNPNVRILNCSVDVPYPSIRTYYSRIYEGKFITGAIAGAMSPDGNIGYVGAYPILGELASINAFALGARLVNPRAKVHLQWSCLPGSCEDELRGKGVRVISNRDMPTNDWFLPSYGTYLLDDTGALVPLASPRWIWGNFYIRILNSMFSGSWNNEKTTARALNYWWGMRSGVIDVTLADCLPEGVRAMAEILRTGILDGTLDPFRRKITAQDGTVMNDGTASFSPEELLRMDKLCNYVEGSIPAYEELLPKARETVRLLGIDRDKIPAEPEVDAP